MVRVFFDTEFTSLDEIRRQLISIGLVAENSEEALYIVLTDGWTKSACEKFVLDVVLPLVDRYNPECLSRGAAAARIDAWLEALRPSPESPLLLLSDSKVDLELLTKLFSSEWAPRKGVLWRDLKVELREIGAEHEYEMELEAIFLRRAHNSQQRSSNRHHALVDAQVIKDAFLRVTNASRS